MNHFIRKGIEEVSKAYKENYAYGEDFAEKTFDCFSCEPEDWEVIPESGIPNSVWEQFYKIPE